MVKIKVRIDHLLFLDAISASCGSSFSFGAPGWQIFFKYFFPFHMMVVVKCPDLGNITLPVSLGGYLHNAELRCGRFYRQFFMFYPFLPILNGPKCCDIRETSVKGSSKSFSIIHFSFLFTFMVGLV